MKSWREVFGLYKMPDKITPENIDEEHQKLKGATRRMNFVSEVALLVLLVFFLVALFGGR